MMSEKWWRRKRNQHWNEFFEEFDKLEKMVDEMMRAAFDESSERRRRKFSSPYVFGFSVSLGPDGKPRVHKFGTLQPSLKCSEICEEREPLVDIMEDEQEVIVIAELPGVDKEDIKLELTKSSLIISVDTTERKYYKELSLPAKVQKNPIQTRYKNGVLEVRLRKTSEKFSGVNEYSLSEH